MYVCACKYKYSQCSKRCVCAIFIHSIHLHSIRVAHKEKLRAEVPSKTVKLAKRTMNKFFFSAYKIVQNVKKTTNGLQYAQMIWVSHIQRDAYVYMKLLYLWLSHKRVNNSPVQKWPIKAIKLEKCAFDLK